MEWKRVKNLLLLLLLACDLVLGVMLVSRLAQKQVLEDRALTDVLSLLEQDGITVDRDQASALESGLPARLADRDADYERAVMERLLGPCSVADQGGGVLLYSSDRGAVTVRNGGYIEGRETGGFLMTPAEALGVSHTDSQTLSGLQLHNTGLSLQNGLLTGRWLLTGSAAYLGDGGQRDQLLLELSEFLGGPARVTGLTQTWLVSGTAGRQTLLEPVWQIETAAGTRYMSLRTGRELSD